MKRSASAKWEGDLKTGKGTVSTESGTLQSTQYSFSTRFENGTGTNPEELIAAAHAGCFTMALSGQLTGKEKVPTSLETTATLTMEKLDAGWTATEIALSLKANVPGITEEEFDTCAKAAKEGCPISRLLDTKITLSYELINS
ncbi:MAG: OsmC family protein [Bdellovibrionales bacterium]|nr:OsmC family protein [Bdellovibrionales bacterium]